MAGFQATGFPSAEAFLESETIKQLDCVIIDINLPGLSGIELQEKLVAIASLPVIFITAHDEPSVRAKVEQSAPVAYLLKPFPSEELIAAVREALDIIPYSEGSEGGVKPGAD